MSAREFLKSHVFRDAETYFGIKDKVYLNSVVSNWMDDAGNSKDRFDVIKYFLPDAKRILDMASGCGTCVFYGLINGYDMYGIDPEKWKHVFISMKASEYKYPAEWLSRFQRAVGEALPYPDNHFDCVTTYQTLEHVRDPEKTISEMFRVTKPGGGIHIRCPDYRATFEGHYLLPWLPLFPRPLARAYLRALDRPLLGLNSIRYVTKPGILRVIRRLEQRNPSWRIKIVNVDYVSFSKAPRKHPVLNLSGTYFGYQSIRYMRAIFRHDIGLNLFIHVLEK